MGSQIPKPGCWPIFSWERRKHTRENLRKAKARNVANDPMILSLKLHQCFVLVATKHFRAVFARTLNGTGNTSLMTILPENCKHHGRNQWWEGKLKHNQILGDKHKD